MTVTTFNDSLRALRRRDSDNAEKIDDVRIHVTQTRTCRPEDLENGRVKAEGEQYSLAQKAKKAGFSSGASTRRLAVSTKGCSAA